MVYAESNLRKGNRLEAMKAYQKVVQIKPNVPDVRNALTRIYLSLNHFKDAYNEISKVLDMDPKNIEGHLLLKKLVKKAEIPEKYKEALEFHLDFKASPRKINILKKQFEMEKRKYSSLINDYERQLEDDEGNPIIMFNKSKAEERLSFAEETLEDLESMVGDVEDEDEVYPGLERPAVVEVPEAETEIEAAVDEENEVDVEVPDYSPDEEETLDIMDEEVPFALSIGVEESGEAETETETGEEAFVPEEDEELEAEVAEVTEVTEEAAELPIEEEIPVAIEEEPAEEVMEELPEEEPVSVIEEPAEPEVAEEAEEVLEATEEVIETADELMLEEQVPEEPVQSVEEVKETVPEKEVVSLISDERMSFYDEMEGSMSKVLKTLNRTRGVTSSLILDNTGYILCLESSEKLNTQELALQVLDGVSPLMQWGNTEGNRDRELLYWVLEFKEGLMVLQPLTQDIYLVVLGKSGANFGAVRYSIEKNTARLVLSLQNAPA